MYCVELNKINLIISLFYRLGIWHREDEPTVRQTRLKIFFSIYYLLFPISLLAGAIAGDNKDDTVKCNNDYSCITQTVLRNLEKKQIIELLNQICVYSIEERDEFILVNDKLKSFFKFVIIFLIGLILGSISIVFLVPFIGSEKKLFLNIWFPLDWKNSEVVFWIESAFIFTLTTLSLIGITFTIITWFLMINCALKYAILEIRIRKIGKIAENEEGTITLSKLQKENIFKRDLIDAIQFNNRIRDETRQVESFLSWVFLCILATSGLCICASIYCIIVGENLIETMIYVIVLFYNIFEIFMVMYLGNEITILSNRFTYCLFASDWVDQPQSSKKYMIIFAEFLKKPYVMIVGKLYPLTMESFTRILNSAYSMFNILKNLNLK